MGKYDNYSVEDCNKCLAELNESLEKLTKQFEAKEIKRFQYNFNRKSNAKQVNEVKARLAELEKEPVEEKLFGPTDEVIADSKAKGLYTEDVNQDLYVYEYYPTEEDAEATASFIREQGRKAEIRKEGEEYAVLTSTSTEDLLEDVVDVMWSAVCSGDTNFVKNAYNKDIIKPNTRYHRFDAKNSLIMGALRNKNFEMAELLKSFGEKILKAELPEYKRIMAEKEYEDETTRTAMEESKELDTDKSKFIDNIMNREQSEVEDFLGYELTDDEFADKHHLRLAIEEIYDQMPEEELVKFEETKIPNEQYIIFSYYDEKFRGLEDKIETSDYSKAEKIIWDKIQKGNAVELVDTITGDRKRYCSTSPEQHETAIGIEDYLLEAKQLTEKVYRYAIDKNSNIVDGMGGDSYFSNEQEAIDVAKELDADTVEKRTYASEQDAEAREIALDEEEIWVSDRIKADREALAKELNEDYEEMEDVDYEDEETISLLDIALKEVPQVGVEDWGKDNELYFVADTISLMEALKPFEEEIPKHYYDNADDYDWSNGVEDYLTSIGIDVDSGEGNNTYNWNAPVTHHINFTTYKFDDVCYVKMEVHLSGDVRGNYSTAFLLKFDSGYDFHESVYDTCAENCFRELKHNDKTYTITPNIFSETVDIFCVETGDNWTDVYCTDLEGLEEVIKQPATESKEIKTESTDDFGILIRELDGQSLYRAHAVKTIDGQDYASYLLKDRNGLGVLSFILPITGTEDMKAKVKAFTKENELKENASVTPEIQKHLDKLESDLLAIPNVTKVEFDTAGYLDGINAPITLVSYEIETQGEQYFNDLAELKSKVFATLEDNGVNVEKDEFEDNDTYFYIVAYSTNWDNKLTEAPTEEDAEYKRLCGEIEFQAEENGFTLTQEDVKAIADKMIADKFFFNHDIMADDKDENAWEEINSLIVSAIEAHSNKIEESANDKVINAVRQGLSKHDVDNLSVDEDEEGNISVMYHSDKDSFPVVQNICKVVDIDKATLIPELDKLDVGKTFLTEDWEDMEDVKTFKFTIVLDTSDPEADIFKKLTHHMEYLLDFDESQYSLSVFDVTTRTEDGAVVVEGEIEVDEDIDADELTEELTYLVVEDGWEDVEMSLASVSVKELK